MFADPPIRGYISTTCAYCFGWESRPFNAIGRKVSAIAPLSLQDSTVNPVFLRGCDLSIILLLSFIISLVFHSGLRKMKMKVCRLRKVIFLLAVWLDVSDALPKHRSLRGGRGQNSFQNPSNNHQRNLKPTSKRSKSSETTSSKNLVKLLQKLQIVTHSLALICVMMAWKVKSSFQVFQRNVSANLMEI